MGKAVTIAATGEQGVPAVWLSVIPVICELLAAPKPVFARRMVQIRLPVGAVSALPEIAAVRTGFAAAWKLAATFLGAFMVRVCGFVAPFRSPENCTKA